MLSIFVPDKPITQEHGSLSHVYLGCTRTRTHIHTESSCWAAELCRGQFAFSFPGDVSRVGVSQHLYHCPGKDLPMSGGHGHDTIICFEERTSCFSIPRSNSRGSVHWMVLSLQVVAISALYLSAPVKGSEIDLPSLGLVCMYLLISGFGVRFGFRV